MFDPFSELNIGCYLLACNCFRYTDVRLSHEEKEAIGYKVKHLLNLGRKYHLVDCGYKVTLLEYVNHEITPENNLLIATKL